MDNFIIVNSLEQNGAIDEEAVAGFETLEEAIEALKRYPVPRETKTSTERVFVVNPRDYESGNYDVLAELFKDGAIAI